MDIRYIGLINANLAIQDFIVIGLGLRSRFSLVELFEGTKNPTLTFKPFLKISGF